MAFVTRFPDQEAAADPGRVGGAGYGTEGHRVKWRAASVTSAVAATAAHRCRNLSWLSRPFETPSTNALWAGDVPSARLHCATPAQALDHLRRQIRSLISDGKNPFPRCRFFSGPRKKSVRETPGGSDPRARVGISLPLSLKQSLLAFLCCLERVVSAAQTPSVRRVELGIGCVLSFLLVIRKHAVLRRSLCATLTALIDPLAAPSGAIADGLTPCRIFRAEVMWIGLLGLRLDRSGIQGGDPGAQRVQAWHRSRISSADHFMIIWLARKQRRDLLIDLAFQPNRACMRLHRLRSAAAPSVPARRGFGW